MKLIVRSALGVLKIFLPYVIAQYNLAKFQIVHIKRLPMSDKIYQVIAFHVPSKVHIGLTVFLFHDQAVKYRDLLKWRSRRERKLKDYGFWIMK
jgi:hypothetical protein